MPRTTAGKPFVARGNRSYLAAWVDAIGEDTVVFGRRVALDGTPLDAQPFVVGRSPGAAGFPPRSAGDVAFDGTNYLVVWVEQQDLRAVRLSESGALLDEEPIAVSTIGLHNGEIGAVRAVWTGSHYLIGWMDQLYSGLLISPPPPMPAQLRFVRLTAAGELLDRNPAVVWEQGGSGTLALDTTRNGSVAFWSGGSRVDGRRACVFGTTIGSDGRAAAVRELLCSEVAIGTPSPYGAIDAAWNGTEYVAALELNGSVAAWRFDAALQPLDAAPFVVREAAFQPAVAATAGGATIAYARMATEPEYGDVPRVFARTLERLGAIGKRRVAR